VIDFGRSCAKHRPALVDFVDHGEVGPSTPGAMAHLERCERCTAAIESSVLTITALRRYADSLDAVDAAPDAWPRLAARITAWRGRSFTMSPLAGVAMSLAIVAVVVLPFRLGPAELGRATGSVLPSAAGTTSSEPDAIRAADRAAPDPFTGSTSITVETATRFRSEPQVVADDIRVTVKEVSLTEPSTRLARAI
jgi:hypothetical protein